MGGAVQLQVLGFVGDMMYVAVEICMLTCSF